MPPSSLAILEENINNNKKSARHGLPVVIPVHQQVDNSQDCLLIDPGVPGQETVDIITCAMQGVMQVYLSVENFSLGLMHPSFGSSSLSGNISLSPYSENMGIVFI